MAWAPATGIAAVQVNVVNGPWHPARLAAADGIDTWRQWVWTWDAAAPGLHTLQVRATDTRRHPVVAARPGLSQRGHRLGLVVVTVT